MKVFRIFLFNSYDPILKIITNPCILLATRPLDKNKKTRALEHSRHCHGEFPQTASDFSPHASLHILDWIYFLLPPRLNSTQMLLERAVRPLLPPRGLNYTIQGKRKSHSLTDNNALSLSASLSFSFFLGFHETQAYSCWGKRPPSPLLLLCGLTGKNHDDSGLDCYFCLNYFPSGLEFLLPLLLLFIRVLCVLKAAAGLWEEMPLCPRLFTVLM